MKLRLLITSITLLAFSKIYCQEEYVCGMPPMDTVTLDNKPWVGNNQFLLDLLDSVGYGNPIPEMQHKQGNPVEGGFDNSAMFWIPVRAWVYNDNNGIGGISEAQVEQSIRRLNDFFGGRVNNYGQANSHTHIQFYLECNITYLNNSTYAHNPSNNDIDQMFDTHHQTGVMNIHYIQTHTTLGGRGRWPGGSKSFACVVNTGVSAHTNSILPHEVAHALDVVHTHESGGGVNNRDANNCRQESVSRTRTQAFGCWGWTGLKCEYTGDRYCDTEADPNVWNQVQPDGLGGWIYSSTTHVNDNWGDPWNPNVYNIMSYSYSFLCEYFSPMQVGTMYWWIWGIPNGNYQPLHNLNEFVDVYEPDNVRRNDLINQDNMMTIGIPQHRGLHAVRTGIKSNPVLNYCDQDYIPFQIPQNHTYKVNIYTEAVPGRPQVDTEIFLIDVVGGTEVVLASNDNKAQGDQYSAINEYELNSGIYWIRVENKGNTEGEYLMNVEICGEECCYNSLIGSVTDINSSIGSFNEGVESLDFNEKYFGSSVIVLGANFGCNTNLPMGFGAGNHPLSNSNLDLTICQEAVINVITGEFVIGDASNNRTANVTFNSGTSLIIHDKLIIEEGSKLIIEDGANFTFFDGAQIELQGPNSILEIRGKVTVGDNATFTFSGDGRIVIDQFIYSGVRDDFWDIGENTSFILEGPTLFGQVMLEFKSNFSPVMENHHTFDLVKIHKGKILLHPLKHME